MIKNFKKIISLYHIQRFCLREKISIFKDNKDNILEDAINHINMNKSPVKYKNIELTREEVLNFDIYYENFYINVPKKNIENALKTMIYTVLQQKLSNDFDKIMLFLVNREKKLKDIETLYIMQKIKENNRIEDLKIVYSEVYRIIIENMKGFSYGNAVKLLDFIAIYKDYNIKDIDLIGRFLMSCYHLAEKYDKNIKDKENYMSLIDAYIYITETNFESGECKEKVLATLKLIMRNFEIFTYQEALDFFMNLHTNNVYINFNHFDRFDQLFYEYKDKFTINEAIDILYIYARNKYNTGTFIQYFNAFFKDIKNHKEFIEKTSSSALSKLIWSISQQKLSTLDESIWLKLESILLESLVAAFPLKDLIICIQAIHFANQGSKIFWCFFTLEKIKEVQLSFNEIFVIIINQQKFNIFNDKILDFFFKYIEGSPDKLNFINEITNAQCIHIYKVSLLGIYNQLIIYQDRNLHKYYDILYDLREKILMKFFSNEKKYRELSLIESIQLYKLIAVTLHMFFKSGFDDNETLINGLETLSRRILRKFELLELEQITKLLIFLDFFQNAE